MRTTPAPLLAQQTSAIGGSAKPLMSLTMAAPARSASVATSGL